jgi:hypothetical protein
VTHEDAWTRLPDLLDDRDDPALLAHVRSCPDCQRQLFLLGRVDRVLRERSSAEDAIPMHASRRRTWLASAAALGAAAAAAVAFAVLHNGRTHDMVLRTASGRPVGHAVLSHSDGRNDSVSLTASGLPVDHGHVFVFWAGDSARLRMQVGRFMVDRSGGCQVRFNLPADHDWGRFWITRPGRPAGIVASM